MEKTILLSFFFILSVQGGPLPQNYHEREELIRDFIRDQDIYQICITNIIFPGSLPSSEEEGSKAEDETSSESGGIDTFQQCMQEAFTAFTEQSGTYLFKRATKQENNVKNGPFSGMPNISNNQIQQCMQKAVRFTDNLEKQSREQTDSSLTIPKFSSRTFQECIQSSVNNFPGAEGSFSGSNEDSKKKRSPEESGGGSGSSSGGGGIPGISNSQIQECMQNAVSFQFPGFGGHTKSGDKEEGSSSGGGMGIPGFSTDKFQQCVQNSMNTFPGAGSLPGLPGSSGGSKKKRSSEESGGGSGSSSGGGGIPGISNSQIQECMQNAVSFQFPGFGGHTKSGDKEEGSSSGGGMGIPGFSTDKFQQCVQNSMNTFPGAGSLPGLPGSSGGSKKKRSLSAFLKRSAQDPLNSLRVSYVSYSSLH